MAGLHVGFVRFFGAAPATFILNPFRARRAQFCFFIIQLGDRVFIMYSYICLAPLQDYFKYVMPITEGLLWMGLLAFAFRQPEIL